MKNYLKIRNGQAQVFTWQFLKPDGTIIYTSISLQRLIFNKSSIYQAVIRDITEKTKSDIELENHRNKLQMLVDEKTKELSVINNELLEKNKLLNEQYNIVNQKNAELNVTLNRLKETQVQLVQSEKMASLGLLTAGVAHELNNPLNFISLGVHGLEDYFQNTPTQVSEDTVFLIRSIKTGIERANAIVLSLNQFNRSTDAFEKIDDLHQIIDNCVIMLQNKVKNRIEVRKLYPKSKLSLMGNISKLHQVFINILDNAIKSIEKVGTITIETKISDQNAIIEITDNGAGIAEENLDKIFLPFFTTKPINEGTGLGLAITYSIIKEHLGNLQFQSELNKGTKVKISLPLNLTP